MHEIFPSVNEYLYVCVAYDRFLTPGYIAIQHYCYAIHSTNLASTMEVYGARVCVCVCVCVCEKIII